MSKKLVTIFIISIIGTLLGIIVLESNRTKKLDTSVNAALNSENPIYYYGITCPNCEDVADFIGENQIDEKITLVKKEVYQNSTNATELTKVAQSCGIDINNIGVPLLYTEGKCLVGSLDIINYLKEKTGLEEDIIIEDVANTEDLEEDELSND